MNHVFEIVFGGRRLGQEQPHMANLLDLFVVCVDCHLVHYLSATLIRNILLLVASMQEYAEKMHAYWTACFPINYRVPPLIF